MRSVSLKTARMLGALWGPVALSLLLIEALYKLVPIAWEALQMPLTLGHWVALGLWVAFMGFTEGYRGFQKAFSPRFAARARWLRDHGAPLQLFLSPLFCMGIFGTTRKRKIVAWALTVGIVCLVITIRLLPQPWRGIIDAGVVVGLSWGLTSLVWFSVLALGADRSVADPEVV
jgi:hypothetical protein